MCVCVCCGGRFVFLFELYFYFLLFFFWVHKKVILMPKLAISLVPARTGALIKANEFKRSDAPLPRRIVLSSGYLHSVARVKRFLSEKKDANSNRWVEKHIKKERTQTRNVKHLKGTSRRGNWDRQRQTEKLSFFLFARGFV